MDLVELFGQNMIALGIMTKRSPHDRLGYLTRGALPLGFIAHTPFEVEPQIDRARGQKSQGYLMKVIVLHNENIKL